MKISLVKEPIELSYIIESYDSINRIPLTITAIPRYEEQSFIELSDENYFIEIGFGIHLRQFFSLDIISVNKIILYENKNLQVPIKTTGYYRFYLQEIDNNEKVLHMEYNTDILKIVFRDAVTSYLNVTNNLFVGIDSENNLTSLIINNVNTKSIFDI